MFNKDRFELVMLKSGLKKKFIANQMGMAYDTFLKKTNGLIEWKVSEALKVSNILRISKGERDSIFFA